MTAAPRVALVTGATRNIGFAIARRLAADGFVVAVNGREAGDVDDAVSRLRAEGHRAVGAVGDVADRRSVESFVRAVTEEVGSVDVLVNNAVTRVFGAIGEVDPDDWERALRVVLTGAFHCVRATVDGMRARGWGRIVNLAGIGGQRGAANHAVTGASKGGLIGLTKALAHELGPAGITVNAISPGFIVTERRPSLGDAEEARLRYGELAERTRAEIPVRRVGDVEDIAAACAYLCDDGAGFVTGQVLGVNGGQYI